MDIDFGLAAPSRKVREYCFSIAEEFPSVSLFTIGHSLSGQPIDCMTLGSGDVCHLVVGAHHGSEHITALVCVRFLRDCAKSIRDGIFLAGFDAKVKSTVLPGSGLSSSAAFEVLIGRILNGLFADNAVSAIEIAQIGQYAENVYYGKPSGLMDQMASSVGGLVFIDFHDPKTPIVEKVDYDFAHSGYTLCTIDSGADHAELTDEYAAMPIEMKKVAHFFGKEVLREVDEQEFYEKIADVRKETGDRAVLRAIHFFNENRRVQMQVRALKNDNFDAFLHYVNESGMASWTLLQNVIPAGCIEKQDMAFTIALCQQLLGGEGAVRVHGGGFAGTALVFVPNNRFEQFKDKIDAAIGVNAVHKLIIQ